MKSRIIAGVILIMLGIGCEPNLKTGINVGIENKGSTVITNVELVFTGGALTVPAIGPGQQKTFTVKPKGESHLVLRFDDEAGQKHETVVNVYFEAGSRGSVELTIDSAGRVEWKDNITIR